MFKQKHRNIVAIYSSNLSRALDTAMTTGHELKVPVKIEPAFKEICHGEAEGMKTTEIRQRYAQKAKALDTQYPHRKDRWNHTAIPNAETYNQVAERVLKALNEIAVAHLGKQVAIFTHSRVIKILIDLFSDHSTSPHVENCCIAEIHSTRMPSRPFKFITLNNL